MSYDKTISSLNDLLNSNGLSRVSQKIIQAALPSLRLTLSQLKESSFALGQTRFGGLPDLPKEVSWPKPSKHGAAIQTAIIRAMVLCKPLSRKAGFL